MPALAELETPRLYVVDEDAPVPNQDLDIEFGEESLMAKGDGFDKISPPSNDKSKVVRVALLTDIVKSKMAYVHFITGKGPVRCSTVRDLKGNVTKLGLCCKRLNGLDAEDRQGSQLSIVVLAFQYKNVNPIDGKYSPAAPPIEWELGWVKLSKSGYQRVSKLVQEDQKSWEFDMLISWKPGTGIGYDYNVIASKCRFRQNPALVAEVMEAAAPYRDGSRLIKKLGRSVTDSELLTLIDGGAATSAATAKVSDVSDI